MDSSKQLMEELKIKLNDAYKAQEDYKKIPTCIQLQASTLILRHKEMAVKVN